MVPVMFSLCKDFCYRPLSNNYLLFWVLCSNYLGNKAWTLNLDWDGKDEFNAADEHEWQGAGLARTAKGLTFLQVYDAGHMVPSDKPAESLDMIRNYVNGGSF